MNYVIFRKFLSIRDCNELLAPLEFLPQQSKDLGLVDGELSDTCHESVRNRGMEYFYSTQSSINHLILGVKKELTTCTGVEFEDTLSSRATVFCRYRNGGVSNPHRDRDKTTDNTFQKYTCLILLDSGKGSIDSEENRRGFDDELFINFDKSIQLAKKGKYLLVEEDKSKRFYPKLLKGDLILFRNDISIHGVDPVIVDNGYRITTAFRSK